MLSMRNRLPTAEKSPQTTPQRSVARHDSPHQSGRKASTAKKTTPTAKTNIPRDRGLRAKSLNTKSLTAAKPRQTNAREIAIPFQTSAFAKPDLRL